MYALLLILALFASYLAMLNPFQAKSLDSAPLVYEKPFDAYSHGLGRDMARFVSGVEAMVGTYYSDQRNFEPPFGGGPIPLARTEIQAQLADPANPSTGYWEMDFADFEAFLAASAYAGEAGFGGAGAADRFFPPNHVPDGPWRVVLVEQLDAGGVGTGELAAVIGYLENVVDGGVAFLDRVSVDDLAKGFRRASNGTINFGVNDGGTLIRRGFEYVQFARTFDNGDGVLDAADNEFPIIDNIPILDRAGNALIPDGVPTYVSCRRADDPASAEGFCD